jgi:hypothetical protein
LILTYANIIANMWFTRNPARRCFRTDRDRGSGGRGGGGPGGARDRAAEPDRRHVHHHRNGSGHATLVASLLVHTELQCAANRRPEHSEYETVSRAIDRRARGHRERRPDGGVVAAGAAALGPSAVTGRGIFGAIWPVHRCRCLKSCAPMTEVGCTGHQHDWPERLGGVSALHSTQSSMLWRAPQFPRSSLGIKNPCRAWFCWLTAPLFLCSASPRLSAAARRMAAAPVDGAGKAGFHGFGPEHGGAPCHDDGNAKVHAMTRIDGETLRAWRRASVASDPAAAHLRRGHLSAPGAVWCCYPCCYPC